MTCHRIVSARELTHMGIFRKKTKDATPPIPADPPPPSEFPKDRNSASGSSDGYVVEARLNYNGASRVINGLPLGPTWTPISFEKGRLGVPQGVVFGADRFSSLLAYPSAEALRWWFVANAAETHDDLCLETRLVEVRLTFSHKEVQTRAVSERGSGSSLRPAG